MKKLLTLSLLFSVVASVMAEEKLGRYFTDAEYREEAQAFAKKHGFEIPEYTVVKEEKQLDDKTMHALPYKEKDTSAVGYQVVSPQEGVIGYQAEETVVKPVRQMDTDYMGPVKELDTDYMDIEIGE